MCDVGKCKRPSLLQYAAFGPDIDKSVSVCERHWEKHCNDGDKFDLKAYFYPSRRKK
jgi:hypothetical protein